MQAVPDIFQNFSSEAFWREQCPQLSISPRTLNDEFDIPSSDRFVNIQQRLKMDGYFQEHNQELATYAPLLAQTICTFRDLHIPPPFIYIFDEAWDCFNALHPVLAQILGNGYQMLPDFWAWYIDPQKEESGWAPHRDRGRMALAADGSPLSATVWIPLTESSALNGCIYVVPASRDKTYNTPDEIKLSFDMPALRALPAKPGEYLCWNQSVMHWGSQASRFAPNPRLSMAMEFQRGDTVPFNTPLLAPCVNLTFIQRLQLIAKQILQYKHMYPLPPSLEKWATDMKTQG